MFTWHTPSHLAALQDHLVNLNKSHWPANLESLGMSLSHHFPPPPLRQALFYWEQFQVRSKIEQKSREFPYAPCPSTCPVSPLVSILHQTGPSVTADEPTLTHHYHEKSGVYTAVHSWCSTFHDLDKCTTNVFPFSLPWRSSIFSLCPR